MYVKGGKMKKYIKNRSQVIFRDFVVQHTGKIGDGARGVLKILAKWRRKRLGKSRSTARLAVKSGAERSLQHPELEHKR